MAQDTDSKVKTADERLKALEAEAVSLAEEYGPTKHKTPTAYRILPDGSILFIDSYTGPLRYSRALPTDAVRASEHWLRRDEVMALLHSLDKDCDSCPCFAAGVEHGRDMAGQPRKP